MCIGVSCQERDNECAVANTALDCDGTASVFLTVVVAAHRSPDASSNSLYAGALRVCPIKPNCVRPDCMSRTIATHDADAAAFMLLTPTVELDVIYEKLSALTCSKAAQR